jgi:alpha-methylacyl-CoA racemase
MAAGPLAGIRIVEIAGIGAAPLATTMLADAGADVIRIDAPSPGVMDRWPRALDVWGRSRRSIVLNLRDPRGVGIALRLVEKADGMIEAFRPGVAERLGLGPDDCLGRNPRLVYGRMTGWGQSGPLAERAGHDLNYIALTGALDAIGRQGQPPTPPLNLIGDGCGAMMMAFGMVCALREAGRSGYGQVVDAAMIDAAALAFGSFYSFASAGQPASERGTNLCDSGAHFYDAYRTADGKFVAVAAIEPQFYARLMELIGLDAASLPDQYDEAHWPAMKMLFVERFASRTQSEWVTLLGSEDTCFAPVLTASEAPAHPHARARDSYINVTGVIHPAPAPRFSRSGTVAPRQAPSRGRNTESILSELGFSSREQAVLRDSGAVGIG